jgi:hypothetical protein
MRLRYHERLAAGRRSSALILIVVLGVSGCTLLHNAGREDGQPGVAAPDGATASPTGSGMDALPDPLHSDRHTVGEEISLPDASVVYLGMSRSAGQIVARFRIVRGSLPASTRIGSPEGELVDLTRNGDVVESAPFGDADHPPARDATVTLVVGNMLIPFEAGKLS